MIPTPEPALLALSGLLTYIDSMVHTHDDEGCGRYDKVWDD